MYNGSQVQKYLRQSIAIRGGLTPYGTPRYRLVWGPDRMEKSGGVWTDWNNNLTVNERNEMKGNKPLRTEVGYRWSPKYGAAPGWVLEKWMPPTWYGTPESWYSPTSEGGTMMWLEDHYIATLGDYPYQGDYEATPYVFPNEALTEAVVLNAIGRIEHQVDSGPSSLEGKIRRKTYLAQQAFETQQQKFEDYAMDVMSEEDDAFGGAAFSSGAGTKREHSSKAVLERMGISSHHI